MSSCAYCQTDTAGNHAAGCLLYPRPTSEARPHTTVELHTSVTPPADQGAPDRLDQAVDVAELRLLDFVDEISFTDEAMTLDGDDRFRAVVREVVETVAPFLRSPADEPSEEARAGE